MGTKSTSSVSLSTTELHSDLDARERRISNHQKRMNEEERAPQTRAEKMMRLVRNKRWKSRPISPMKLKIARSTKSSSKSTKLIHVGGSLVTPESHLQTTMSNASYGTPESHLHTTMPNAPHEISESHLQTTMPDAAHGISESLLQTTMPDAPHEIPESQLQNTMPDAPHEIPESQLQNTMPDASHEVPESQLQNTMPDASHEIPEPQLQTTMPDAPHKIPESQLQNTLPDAPHEISESQLQTTMPNASHEISESQLQNTMPDAPHEISESQLQNTLPDAPHEIPESQLQNTMPDEISELQLQNTMPDASHEIPESKLQNTTQDASHEIPDSQLEYTMLDASYEITNSQLQNTMSEFRIFEGKSKTAMKEALHAEDSGFTPMAEVEMETIDITTVSLPSQESLNFTELTPVKFDAMEIDQQYSPPDDSDTDPTYHPGDENNRKRVLNFGTEYNDSSDSEQTENVIPSPSRTTITLWSTATPSTSADTAYSAKESSSVTVKIPTPVKQRKKQCKPENWAKNIAKSLRNRGKEYVSQKTKKTVQARKMKPTCYEVFENKKKENENRKEKNVGTTNDNTKHDESKVVHNKNKTAENRDKEQKNTKCRLKCPENVSDDERKNQFDSFWSIGSIEGQRLFLQNLMEDVLPQYEVVRTDGKPKRSRNQAYYFDIDGRRVRVCKTFFMNTLDISNKMVTTVMQKKKATDLYDRFTDKRGNKEPGNSTSPELVDSVKQHINSIPRVESHYCRSSSKKEYIPGGNTVAGLHSDYRKKRESEHVPFVSEQVYRNIFNTQFNISFHIPKKDQCELCEKYKNTIDDEDLDEEQEDLAKLKYEHGVHMIEKDLARGEKNNEIDKLKCTPNLVIAIFDLQAVLQCPRGDVSSFYYHSKLNCFNLTVYDVATKEVNCYVWNETEGKRGADEICSCIYKYLESINEKALAPVDVIFFSDNCTGQNKNRYMLGMYKYAVTQMTNIRTIHHKFLITGHTQNEGDSVHSVIERNIAANLKSGPIYTTDQYVQIIRSAKKTGQPYKVIELTHEDFFSFKDLERVMGIAHLKSLKITNVKTMLVSKNENILAVRYSYTETEDIKMEMKKVNHNNVTLKRAYNKQLPLKPNKMKDLKNMIDKKIIPPFYKNFYHRIIDIA